MSGMNGLWFGMLAGVLGIIATLLTNPLRGVAWRSLYQHRLATWVTIVASALASGLVMAVYGIAAQTRQAFIGGQVGYDAIVAARSSRLQLVLNAVFHLEASSGNLPWATYQALRADPRVALAVPYALGDNYHGYRIIGTTTDLFDVPLREGRLATYIVGEPFQRDRREAVIGYTVAARTGLRIGHRFQPYHGLDYSPTSSHQHSEDYTVVGVMRPTGSPWDRVIWIPLEGFWRIGGHTLVGDDGREVAPEAGVAIPDEVKEVSAVMVRFREPGAVMAGMELSHAFNRRTRTVTCVWPIASAIGELFERIGWVVRVLELVAALVVLVAAAAILAAITNTIHERRREFAILRALGARRRDVFAVVLLEAVAIAAVGALLGYLICALLTLLARYVILEQTGVVLEIMAYHPALIWTPLGIIAVGVIAGLIPGFAAYRTDVAAHLVPSS